MRIMVFISVHTLVHFTAFCFHYLRLWNLHFVLYPSSFCWPYLTTLTPSPWHAFWLLLGSHSRRARAYTNSQRHTFASSTKALTWLKDGSGMLHACMAGWLSIIYHCCREGFDWLHCLAIEETHTAMMGHGGSLIIGPRNVRLTGPGPRIIYSHGGNILCWRLRVTGTNNHFEFGVLPPQPNGLVRKPPWV